MRSAAEARWHCPIRPPQRAGGAKARSFDGHIGAREGPTPLCRPSRCLSCRLPASALHGPCATPTCRLRYAASRSFRRAARPWRPRRSRPWRRPACRCPPGASSPGAPRRMSCCGRCAARSTAQPLSRAAQPYSPACERTLCAALCAPMRTPRARWRGRTGLLQRVARRWAVHSGADGCGTRCRSYSWSSCTGAKSGLSSPPRCPTRAPSSAGGGGRTT